MTAFHATFVVAQNVIMSHGICARVAFNLRKPTDLLAISGAIAAQVQQAYATSWARKAAVDAATTIDEVNAA